MNNVIIIGRITRDLELKYTQSGMAILGFNVAVDRNLSAEKRQEAEANNQPTADFINCKAFNKTAELINSYFAKGQKIGVIGRIQTGSYEKDGRTVYTTDVVVDKIEFIEMKSNNNAVNRADPAYTPAGNKPYSPNQGGNADDDDVGFYPVNNDDIPF